MHTRHIYIPKEAFGAELRAGRVKVEAAPVGGARGGIAARLAADRLEKGAASGPARGLHFPACCCHCLREGSDVLPVECVCIVGMVVPYTVRLAIPHCSSCVDTANRRRLGSTGPFAIFLAFSISIVLAIVGIATERNRWTRASFVVGPLVGLALIIAWSRRRRPGAAQTTAFQAVRVSRLDLDFSGVPRGAVLSFANSTYADRFRALNPTGPVGPS